MSADDRSDVRADLRGIADLAADFLESLPDRAVDAVATPAELLRALDGPLPEKGLPAAVAIRELVAGVERGLVASAGPRYFGFVVGGATRAGLMADWLTSAWDQNAQVYATSPAAAVVEDVVARWILELLELPATSSVGFVTGCQMANFTALACARDAVLGRAGFDVETNGLSGAPSVTVIMSRCGHATVRSALRMLGLGTGQLREVPADAEGRMELPALEAELRRAAGGPLILALQAGNVNTGAFEPIGAIAELVQGRNAWLHVDGAFGLWAAVSPDLRPRLAGLERADSWATDAHKWLNVPYDSGIVIMRDAALHRRLKMGRCAYAGAEAADRRDGSTWVPENSRRARAFVLYAVLCELGRTGVRDIVERCCELARRFADGAARLPGAQVVNDVVLNQVLVRFDAPTAEAGATLHRTIAERIRAEGRSWLGATTWEGQSMLRVSVCNWSTTPADIDATLAALARALRNPSAGHVPPGAS